MKTDKQIKSEATRKHKYSVFEHMNNPHDIFADCSDGMWVRKLWKNINRFGWDKWEKVN